MVVLLKKQLGLFALLLVNHIASFVVTAAILIWFETIFPLYGDAPSSWIIIIPLRTAILYTLHSYTDRQLLRKSPTGSNACQQCRRIRATPAFSLITAVIFQVLFYEPRWICAVVGVSDEGPMCSLPQAIILELPLGFTLLLLADLARSIHEHDDAMTWAKAHCSARDTALHLVGFVLALSTAVTRYDRMWTLSMDLFKLSAGLPAMVLLMCLVQIEAQLITTAISYLERRVWPLGESNSAVPAEDVMRPRKLRAPPRSRPR